MHTLNKEREIQQVYEDRGDRMRRNREVQSPAPRDRGDARKKSAAKAVTSKLNLLNSKAENVTVLKTEKVTGLVARSTNKFTDSSPNRFLNRAVADNSPEKFFDFRKRVKDRYTFKHFKTKDDDTSQFNDVLHKNELPKSNSAYTENQKTIDFRDAKKSEKASVHRAISAIKFNHTPKSDEATRRPREKQKNSRKEKRPVIKTITSKKDSRVYKAVTFVEQTAKKPLHIRIPKDLTKPNFNVPTKRNASPIVSRSTPSTRTKLRKRSPQSSGPHKSGDPRPMEVARWAPESVDQLTQPYYDAWVSKIATASTKLVKKASFEKSKVLKSLKCVTPELTCAPGTIRVRRRGDK